MRSPVTCFFASGAGLRSRSVGAVVLHSVLNVPVPPLRLQADWARETTGQLDLQAGDVEEMPLARARARWPDYRLCVATLADWTRSLGLGDLLATSPVALMACRGARYHHDGAQYGHAAFCNLFLSEDQGLDLHFAALDLRIPLQRGTAVVFDTGQPHAVIARRRSGFDSADFPPGPDHTQLFLSWELPIEEPAVAQALHVRLDSEPAAALLVKEGQVWVDGAAAGVCPASGRWRALA